MINIVPYTSISWHSVPVLVNCQIELLLTLGVLYFLHHVKVHYLSTMVTWNLLDFHRHYSKGCNHSYHPCVMITDCLHLKKLVRWFKTKADGPYRYNSNPSHRFKSTNVLDYHLMDPRDLSLGLIFYSKSLNGDTYITGKLLKEKETVNWACSEPSISIKMLKFSLLKTHLNITKCISGLMNVNKRHDK